MSEQPPDRTLSELYHVLRASRRRYVIQLLFKSEDDIFSVRTLAKEIAAVEENIPVEQATGESYRNVYNALAQTHLSTLSDANLIIYDSDRQTVSPGPDFQIGVLFTVLSQATYQTFQKDFLNSFDRTESE